MKNALRPLVGTLRALARRLGRWLRGVPPVGTVAWGDLRRTRPLCADYGHSRGLPVDRVYIERFLAAHAGDIRGQVLEIGGDDYTRRFGGDRVTANDVLDIEPRNPRATVIADLTDAPQLADARYDAIILTQTLQLIFDTPAAIRTLHRLLKPGGVLLVTVSGVSSIGSAGGDDQRWCWSFTPRSLRLLLGACFATEAISVASHGNVLTAVAFLEGIAAEELAPEEYDAQDVDYPIVVSARAVKSGATR